MGAGASNVFQYKKGRHFNGIVAYLTKCCQGNPAEKDLMEVTASSTSVRCLTKPEELLILRDDGEWTSNNEEESWIMFSFTKHQVELSNYTIQTFSGKTGTTHLKTWKLEGSNDGFDWVTLDNVVDSDVLNGPDAVMTRSVTKAGFFTKFRIVQLGKNWFGTNCLTVKRVEFFGKVLDKQ